MSDGNGKQARAWLRANKGQLPPEELPNEAGSRAGDIGGSRNSPTRDGKALAAAAHFAECARDILDHPALSERDRLIWRLHLDDVRWDGVEGSISDQAACSTTTIKKTIDRVKALMLAPGQAPAAPKDAASEAFKDLERTIELGAYNAHRVITDVHNRASTRPEDVENNERAVRTILAIRKSEYDYLRLRKPPEEQDDDKVRAKAGAVRV